MSTLKATNLQNASSATTNAVLNTDGTITTGTNMTVTGTAVMSSPYTMRNKIINGAMVIDQRNAGASVTPTANTYLVDRWTCGLAQSSKLSFQQSTTAPSGFSNSLLCTSLSAYTVGAAEAFVVRQYIEGFNFADMQWGTTNAQTVTLSFWVRSSLTGTFGGSVKNSAADRSYPFSYTISAANTFEYKTVVISGDTTGTWVGATNGTGVIVAFSLGAGASASASSGSWASGNYNSATGAQSVVGTNGATFYVTGVQLERGTIATPFEWRNYQQELAMCQRYYQSISSGNAPLCSTTDQVTITYQLPVTMRATPALSYPYTDGTYDNAGPASGKWTFNRGFVTNISKTGTISTGTGITNAYVQIFFYGMTLASVATGINSNAQANITFSAEL